MGDAAAWAGSASDFLRIGSVEILESLIAGHQSSLGMAPARSQLDAWTEELDILRQAVEECVAQNDAAGTWGIVLEYELPLEGGRRPDAVVITGSGIAVLEFKQSAQPTRAFVDQTESYARDLADYHSLSHGRHVLPVLVLTKARNVAVDFSPVVITARDELSHYLLENAAPGKIVLNEWLDASYEPLPTLVAAARRIFENKPLPHVHTALAEDIPGTVRRIAELIREAETKRERKLVLITGVPGSGKTLVGLRVVYERSETAGRGIFLSGNGPLVKVLQHTLESRVFVRDLHAYIKTYGINRKTPNEHIIVFDEAQRAWDAAYMHFKKGVARSEPSLLIEIGERIPDWAVLVGLVGEGQQIFSGEEAGIPAWREAIIESSPQAWTVHAPSELVPDFSDCAVWSEEKLALTIPLRSRRATLLHEWVNYLLAGSFPLAARIAVRLSKEEAAFPLYLTRNLEHAKSYARLRYQTEPERRYGLLIKAYAKIPRKYGVDNHFKAQQTLMRTIGPWFDSPPDHPLSCCRLESAVTEFQVQGLELDLPIVCWGENLLWIGGEWRRRPARAQFPQQDPDQLLLNGYRVLLTRGRDALIVWLPPERDFNSTEVALLAAGFKPLEEAEEEVRQAAAEAT